MSALISNGFPPLQKTSIKMLFLVFFSASIILVLIAMTGRTYHIPLDKLTSDPAAIAAINPLYGVLSNLGIILWGAATFSCALAAVVLRSMEPKKGYLFLLYSSLLSAYLMLDDLFQFHEDLSSSIGLNQKVIYLFLGTAVIAYLIYFRKILFQTNIIPFLIALAFLFLSIVADTIVYKLYGSQLGNWLYLIEDGAKWIGIVFWAYYFFYTSFQFITGNTGVSNAAK
ncbi:hypothetical protein POV26_09095 [Aequorivita todarodis]|uniref:hypothetical protein n=1 Tax=Aequorivita todarodis TaxID=2036821 RepID=UPI00234FB6E5|nr:hypothetical protein [Aequorivita todarodis]MDC8001193.1 hypothetical protein [Aequorivita todarodis]